MSPLRDVDPFCGDVIYSESLLERPPPGVTYVRYDEALANGEIREHGRRQSVSCSNGVAARGLSLFTWARERFINLLRQHGALYREPFRLIEILGRFDLVHCHTFSVRWTGLPTPVLVSNALPLRELYSRARGWGAIHVAIADRVDRQLARASGVSHIEYGLGEADRVVTFTQTLADWYIDQGVPAERVGVVPCFPAGLPNAVKHNPVPGRIGFIAGDFAAKGGHTVIASMSRVRKVRPDAHVVIAGNGVPVSAAALDAAGAILLGYVPREDLINDVLPSCEVFAYPSHFDGLPLTLLEALATGVPCVVSDYFALPEIVGPGGRVIKEGDSDALAETILDLLEPSINYDAARAAIDRYESTFDPAIVIPLLRSNYDAAILTRAS
jgi:glycosyltransferase involved in cell wall biosynthesis